MTDRLSTLNRAVALSLFLLGALSAPAMAGIEEHNPNPMPSLFELELLVLDLDEHDEELPNERDETTKSRSPIERAMQMDSVSEADRKFHQDIYAKWAFARLGIDYVTDEENANLEAETFDVSPDMASSTPSGARDNSAASDADDSTPPKTATPARAAAGEDREEAEDEFGEVEGRIEGDEDQDGDTDEAGCAAANSGPVSNTALALLLGYSLLTLAIRRRRVPVRHR